MAKQAAEPLVEAAEPGLDPAEEWLEAPEGLEGLTDDPPDYGISLDFTQSDPEPPVYDLDDDEALDQDEEPAPLGTPESAPTPPLVPPGEPSLDNLEKLSPEELKQVVRGFRAEYTRKNTDTARKREAVEQREAELDARDRQPAAPPAGTIPDGVLPDPETVRAIDTWAQQFEAATGRAPNVAEAVAWTAQYESRRQVEPRLKTIEDATREREAETVQNRAQTEFAALCAEVPEAKSPGVDKAVGDYMVQRGMFEPGDVQRAFWALYGPQIAQRRAGTRQQVRETQAVQARRAPVVPPPSAPSEIETGPPPTSSFDEIAERQRRNPTIRARLREFVDARR